MTNSKRAWGVLVSLIAWVAMARFVIGDERAAAPFSADSLRSAAGYLKDRNGHAMLVYHRDKLVFEEYFNGWSADKPHLYIIPSLDLVVVQFAETEQFDERDFLERLLVGVKEG